MKISELLRESEILDEVTRPAMNDAVNILRKAGYRILGTGVFGAVFGKPDANHVLKLFSATDKAYIDFVNLVRENPNPHFPRFKGKLMKITDEYYAIQMEKLTPIYGPEGVELAQLMNNYSRGAGHQGMKYQTKTEVIEKMRKLEKTQPGIRRACLLIAKRIPSRRIDIHDENIMMREQTVVITDPVAF